MNQIEIFRQNKESKKHALESFTLKFHNNLDRPIDKLLDELQKEIDELNEEYKKLTNIQILKNDEYYRLMDLGEPSEYTVDMMAMDKIEDIMYLEDELLAISESKIIYAYKHFEVSLKNLLRIAYGSNDNLQSFKWDQLKQYFKTKNIILSKLNGYDEINLFRLVNNTIKHSNEINSNIENIPEFKDLDFITYDKLMAFYERVKNSPELFISSLNIEILKDLYEFDEKRLNSMAERLTMRMDRDTAEIFISKLKNRY